jgi:hypothetical protein
MAVTNKEAKRKKMGVYGGYVDSTGITKMLREFSVSVDASVKRAALEDVEDSRLGVGYGYVGYVNGTFPKGGI